MKARPILFSAPMVRALLDGRKTMTRRVVKLPESATEVRYWSPPGGRPTPGWANPGVNYWTTRGNHLDPCPYGVPGDLLWVRETFADTLGMGFDDRIHFAADTQPGSDADEIRKAYGVKWKPSIHMPRWASRLTLRVTDVRVERVQDISEEDAMGEGVAEDTEPCDHKRRSCGEIGCLGPGYRAPFASLWDCINGPDAWDRNDWVWVVCFEVIRANVDSVEVAVDG